MANQNFVVHNGITVGQFTVDAATSNVALPVAKQLAIGNVILRDNGDGRLAVRDITDNNDAIIVATVDAPSVTQGNIQIGTNHIESVNVDGPISLRPNGNGPLVFAANLVSAGKGSGTFEIATGLAMPTEYGVTYANANILLSPGRQGLYSGNVRVTQTTAASSTTTGAFQVMGGVGIVGNINVGTVGAVSGAFHNIVGNINQSSSGGIVYINTAGNIMAAIGQFGTINTSGNISAGGNVLLGSNVTIGKVGQVSGAWHNIVGNINQSTSGGAVNFTTAGNIVATSGWVNAGSINVTGNVLATVAEVGSLESAGTVYANSTVASTSNSTGALIVAGGIGVAKDSTIGGNLTVQGNLFVQGNVTTISANNLIINDSLIYMADDNPADLLDIGLISSFTSGAGYQHTGFARDASDGIWKLFAGVTTEPTTTIDFTGATYSTLQVGNITTGVSGWANIGSINAGGNILGKVGTLSSLTVNGATTQNGTLTVSSGFLNSSGNILATGGVFNALAVNGVLTMGGNIAASGDWITISTANVEGNILAKNSVLQTLTVNGEIDSQNIVPLATNTYSVGSTTLWYSAFWGKAVNAAYADLAEKYAADAAYEPGTVLMFGGEQEVTLCEHDMSTAVAGVVSTNPAYLMNHQISGENIVDLALTGRVPTKVTGTVKKGDMMVSAGNGRARAEANPRVGSVIGKALENSEGNTVIEVVVGKH